MNLPTDTLYKFLAVIGFVVMSSSIAMWLKDRSVVQKSVAAEMSANAAYAETRQQLIGYISTAETLTGEVERHIVKARTLYATDRVAEGDDELNEAHIKNRAASKQSEKSGELLQVLGSTSVNMKQASAVAESYRIGHSTLQNILALGFIFGLVVFFLSCMAWRKAVMWQRDTKQ